MSESAQVFSIEDLKEFRNGLCAFGTDANDALCSIELQIHRTFDWLQDQAKFWQRTIRDCQEDVVQAKAELASRKYPNALGRIPDCTVQEEALEEALRRLDLAEEKLEKVRRWSLTLLPYAVTEYEGPARQLGSFVESELPRSLALLDRKIAALDAYVSMTAPLTPSGPAPVGPAAVFAADTRPVVPVPQPTPSGGDRREPDRGPDQAAHQSGQTDPVLGRTET